MNIDYYKDVLKNKLSPSRYKHSLQVYEVAITLAQIYSEDEEKVGIAALLHDYAKDLNIEELTKYVKIVDKQLLKFDSRVWHGPVGAYLVKKELSILDKEVYNAIYYHVYGRPNMTNIEKIVYVSDYIEPGRTMSGVDEIREMAKNDLNKAVLKTSQNIYEYLIKNNFKIHPNTFETFKYYEKLLEV